LEDNNVRDNETRLRIAGINSNTQLMNNESAPEEKPYDSQRQAELEEKMRQFDDKQKLERDKFDFDKTSTREDQRLKEKQINKTTKRSK